MRQRVKVAQALVHDPAGASCSTSRSPASIPRQRLHIIDLFQPLGADGRCVIVSSHVLDEVERFGSRVLVIAQGRLAAEGDFRAIRELMDDRPPHPGPQRPAPGAGQSLEWPLRWRSRCGSTTTR